MSHFYLCGDKDSPHFGDVVESEIVMETYIRRKRNWLEISSYDFNMALQFNGGVPYEDVDLGVYRHKDGKRYVGYYKCLDRDNCKIKEIIYSIEEDL